MITLFHAPISSPVGKRLYSAYLYRLFYRHEVTLNMLQCSYEAYIYSVLKHVFNVTILKHGFILHMPLINVIYWVTLTFLVSLNNLISRSNRGACPLHTICIISIIINIIIITTIQVKESII